MSCGVVVFPGVKQYVHILDLKKSLKWVKSETIGYFKTLYKNQPLTDSEDEEKINKLAAEIKTLQ